MSSEYEPASSAALSLSLYTALLSARDVSIRVPINYVTTPGVALTAACFSDNHFEDGPAQKCFSNLLSIGFSRFVIDLYWDISRLSWSLCPVELANGGAVASPSGARNASTSLTTRSSSTSASATLTRATLAASTEEKRKRAVTLTLSEPSLHASHLQARQTDNSFTASSNTNTVESDSTSSSTTSTGNNAGSTTLPNSGGTLHQIGPYTCDSSLGLTNMTNVFADYLERTENSLNATLKYLIFNLHSAANYDDPTGSAPTPEGSLLPDTGNYISELLNFSLSSYIYTPVSLDTQRANLNSSWYTVQYDYRPLTQYLDVNTSAEGILSSDSSWPSESYIELQRALRFLSAFGTIDPQMQGYNLSADTDTIFLPGYITDYVNATISSSGEVTAGCIFQENSTAFSAANSSWAVSSSTSLGSDSDTLLVAAGNLTSCGIAPILNTTLGSTADDDISAYIDYIQQNVWAWAPDEPRDVASSSDDFHCAAINMSNGGKWQVVDCGDRHYGACRIAGTSYNWTVTNQSGPYSTMDDACEDNVYSVPRTALENAYLQRTIRTWQSSHDDDDTSDLFWLNFNDLDETGCWVNGANSTCPYVQKTQDTTRIVVVPVVAAVIVIVLAIATIFIKCAGNRQNAKRRTRRGDGGWDYEGVPS